MRDYQIITQQNNNHRVVINKTLQQIETHADTKRDIIFQMEISIKTNLQGNPLQFLDRMNWLQNKSNEICVDNQKRIICDFL